MQRVPRQSGGYRSNITRMVRMLAYEALRLFLTQESWVVGRTSK